MLSRVKIHMAGFLTTGQLANINSQFDTLHTTFAKTVTVYKNSERTVIESPQFNSVYGRTNSGRNTSITYATVSGSFEARTYYVELDETHLAADGAGQIKVVLPAGSVRLVVKEDGYEFIREARRVEFDGNRFAIKSDGLPYGLGSNKFFTFFLTPTEE